MLCIGAWVHCSPLDSLERLSRTKIHHQILACRHVDYSIFALVFADPYVWTFKCITIVQWFFWRQSWEIAPFNFSNGWTSKVRRWANQRAETQISDVHYPHQTACQATAYLARAQSIQCLSAHVPPSECAIFISGEMITVSDKPIIKPQILAKTQQSTRAVFLHCLLDVIRRRFCVWPLGIKKPSCPKCLCDTVWERRKNTRLSSVPCLESVSHIIYLTLCHICYFHGWRSFIDFKSISAQQMSTFKGPVCNI